MPPTHSHRPDDSPASRRPRGERLWHGAADAIFLLNGQRRLLYANLAWEKATGVTFAEARGRVCRRRTNTADLEPVELALSALAPPPEALLGQPCQTRRRAPDKPLQWWAVDYFPWSNTEGVQAILGKIRVIQETGPAHALLPEKLVQLRQRSNQLYRLESWDSEVPAMQRLVAQLRLAAQTRLPALIQGPPGSGKEWAARTIHHASVLRESNFATLDSRLPPAALADLLASSRHWHIGTLYVKTLERLPRDAQALLLQYVHNGSSDVQPRLLAGSSANLDHEQRAGRLLPELIAGLGTLTIYLPALTDRRLDLPRLVEQLLERANRAAATSVRTVSSAALERLQQHDWPGNLAELYEALVQACRRTTSEQLDVTDLPFQLQGAPAPPDKPLPLDETLAKVERRMIELALRLAQSNKSKAAELLAIWRQRLLRRLEQLGLDSNDAPANEDG